MVKVNFRELPFRDFKHWLILTSISHFDKRFKKLIEAEGFDVTNLDVKLVVNGISFPLDHAFNRMEAQWDQEVEAKAKELLLERCSDISNMLYDIEQEIKYKAREVFPEINWED